MDYTSVLDNFYMDNPPAPKLKAKPTNYDVGVIKNDSEPIESVVEPIKKVTTVTPKKEVQLPEIVEDTNFSWSDDGFRDRLLDAQMGAESAFRPDVISGKTVSSAGAIGIAQFMPDTWADVIRRGWVPADSKPTDVEHAVKAQYLYMNRAYNLPQVRSAKTERERIERTLAAYNAGEGSLKKALAKASENGTHWKNELPKPSETIPYIDKILNKVSTTIIDKNYQSRFNRSNY